MLTLSLESYALVYAALPGSRFFGFAEKGITHWTLPAGSCAKGRPPSPLFETSRVPAKSISARWIGTLFAGILFPPRATKMQNRFLRLRTKMRKRTILAIKTSMVRFGCGGSAFTNWKRRFRTPGSCRSPWKRRGPRCPGIRIGFGRPCGSSPSGRRSGL